MAEKKKWIRERGLIEIAGKEFPTMLFALIKRKKYHYEVQSYVRTGVLPKSLQDKIRKFLRIGLKNKNLCLTKGCKNKVRS